MDANVAWTDLDEHALDEALRDPDNLAVHPAVRGIVTGDVDQRSEPHGLRGPGRGSRRPMTTA